MEKAKLPKGQSVTTTSMFARTRRYSLLRKGSYLNRNDKDLSNFACSSCPPGEYQNDSKYSQPTECKQCTPGFFQENSSAVNCAVPGRLRTGRAAKAFASLLPWKVSRMRAGKHAAKSAEAGRYKAELKSTTECKLCPKGPSQGIHLKIVKNAFHAVQGNGAMLLARTTTQFVETALLVGTHLPLVCQKNLVASFARKGNLVKKMATLHQLRDARTAIRANTEEMILRQHLARLVA